MRVLLAEISAAKDISADPGPTETPPAAPSTSTNRYSDWEEDNQDEADNELERYLREPKGNITDLLQWWQARVSFDFWV